MRDVAVDKLLAYGSLPVPYLPRDMDAELDSPISPQSTMDLLPRRLATSSSELAFVATLGPLVSTPRAAKRLVNLYRLLRARFHGADLDEFLDAGSRETPHRAVLLLLAVLVGHPNAAPPLFNVVAKAAPDAAMPALLDQFDGDPVLAGNLAALNTTDTNWPRRSSSAPISVGCRWSVASTSRPCER